MKQTILMGIAYGFAANDKWLWFALTLAVFAAAPVFVVLVME